MNPSSTIIRDVKIKGTLEFSESLFLDCHFEGEIISKGELTIGEHASVQGEIQADQITLFGKLEGNVVARGACRIKGTATMIGDVKSDKIEVAEGAIFQGYADVPFKKVQETTFSNFDTNLDALPQKK